MKDRKGTEVHVGDHIEYCIDGDLGRIEDGSLMITEITCDASKRGHYKRKDDEAEPFAMVNDGEGTLKAPFFSYEMRKLEPEELI